MLLALRGRLARKKRAEKAAKKAQKRGKGSKRRRNSSANPGGALTQAQINQLLAASGGQNQLALMKQVEWMRNEIASKNIFKNRYFSKKSYIRLHFDHLGPVFDGFFQ